MHKVTLLKLKPLRVFPYKSLTVQMYKNVLTNGFYPHINVENDDVFKTVQNGNQIH